MIDRHDLYLSFYGLVGVRVSGPPSIVSFLGSEWQQFRVTGDDQHPDIVATWGTRRRYFDGAPLRSGRRRIGGWYRGCFWRAVVAENGGRTQIEYWTFPRSNHLFEDACLEPIVRERLESTGLHTLHASSLLVDGQAWIFCGPPRSGKTMLALAGIRSGQKFLSDDLSIIGRGRAYPYTAPFRIYPHYRHQLRLQRELDLSASPRELIAISLISAASLGKVRVPIRLFAPPDSLPDMDQATSYPLGGVFLLRPSARTARFMERRDRSGVVQDLIRNSPMHGASLVAKLGDDGGQGRPRAPALESELGDLVEKGRVFEIDTRGVTGFAGWKEVLEQAINFAREAP